MKWLHLSHALQFLTSRRGRDILSHFTANKDDERDTKIFVALSVFIFRVPQPRTNIGKYQPGRFAYANACLRDTYSMRASCALREVVCKWTAAHRQGGLAFGCRLCLWQEVFMYLAVTSPHCLHTQTAVNHRQDFFALCKSRSEDIAAVAHPAFKETKAAVSEVSVRRGCWLDEMFT